ncbi:MAG: hypothetical protein H6Q90_1322 [Deltaproteobacteria bacterium]|nr:hypothetical protein [Deltaproteobacteria bacterium]
MGKRLLPLPITDAPRRSRTVHDYPGIISVQRQDCGDDFFAPDEPEIDEHGERIRDFLKTPSVALLLPLASERERETFSSVIHYVTSWGVRPSQVAVVYTAAAAKVVEDLELQRHGYLLIQEDAAISLCDTQRIRERFGVELHGTRGKGRAIFAAFLHLKYIAKRSEIRELFLFDVDVIVGQYRPLEYLAYPHVSAPSPDRLFVLTAQNNARRDNHYLVVPREIWRHESDLGRHYVRHFDKIVWSLTGEMSMRWSDVVDSIPFAVGYGIETVWQLFAADLTADRERSPRWSVSQVVNPWTKEDGGNAGASGRCYDAMMYLQLNRMAWFLIKHGKHLSELGADDYRQINTRLGSARETSILPDNGDHGPPYLVNAQSDLFIPPIHLLRSEGCLRVAE